MCRSTHRHVVIVSIQPPRLQQQLLMMMMMMMMMMILSAAHSAGKLLSFRHRACYAQYCIIQQQTCFLTHNSSLHYVMHVFLAYNAMNDAPNIGAY